MLSAILKLLPIVLGWLGLGPKSERTLGQEAGEKIGRAENENVALKEFIKTEDAVRTARDGVSDAPDSVLIDPDNAGPAAR